MREAYFRQTRSQVNTMSYSSISSNRVEFLEGVATPAFLQKSKQPFDADIDDAFLSFFAGCAMNDELWLGVRAGNSERKYL